jgi:hypothetical protein
LESGLLDQELEFRLRLCVAGQQQLPSAGRRQMDIDQLDGGRRGMQTAPKRVQATRQERDDDVGFDLIRRSSR